VMVWGGVTSMLFVYFLLYLYECMYSLCVLGGWGWRGVRWGEAWGKGGGVHRCVSLQFRIYRCVSL